MSEALVARIKTYPHPNADRLQLGRVSGYQVITGLNTEDGQLGVLFPADTQLSHEHCMANNLYAKNPETGEEMGGYFGKNRRVRAQRFRGEKSEAYWEPLHSLEWTGVDTSKLKEGDSFTSLNGKEVCCKYITPKQKRMSGVLKGKNVVCNFKEVGKTHKLRRSLREINPGDVVHITEKVHGTSGRTGRLLYKTKLNRFQKFWNKYFGIKWKEEEWTHVTGSRRVVYDPHDVIDSGFYNSNFRNKYHDMLKTKGLLKGETIYYEIVGFTEEGIPIMPPQDIQDKKLRTMYGNTMQYSYGCAPKENAMYVYRITLTNEDGHSVRLPRACMEARCEELGLTPVPLLKTAVVTDEEALLALCEELSATTSALDPTHISEGVCVEVNSTETFKYKSFWFCELEGISKNNDDYVDPEDLA